MRAYLASSLVLALIANIGPAAAQGRPSDLRSPESFRSVADPKARSLALIGEAGKVLTHPRCVNCHPVSDRPLQTNAGIPHLPPVRGGEGGMGPASMPCSACHGAANYTLVGTRVGSMPGNPQWHLAPREMAWQGKSVGDICRQIKDPARNGGKTLAALHEHMAKDELVGWGWAPGAGREPAPGTQAVFGELIKAWIDTGAECPT